MTQPRLILGAAIGDCVHVAGVVNFLNLAESTGIPTICLGPAISVPELLAAVSEHRPDTVAVGYRLTPGAWAGVLQELRTAVAAAGLAHLNWVFGGTTPCAQIAAESGFFTAVFPSDATPTDALAFLRGGAAGAGGQAEPPQTLVERIAWKAPYPLIRHHFGQPTVAATVAGAWEIAQAGVLDVLSLGTDQNAQEHFFRPDEMEPAQDGAGGVPVRTARDLQEIYAHTRTGNYPLVRCYSGTRDTMRWAEMLQQTIHNAWCAIPLFWYTRLDGRSRRSLAEAIPETQALMRWHAQRGIPVEMNESHHWSLRDAPDVVAVAAAYLAACNARAAGVQDYIQQLMFNNPPGTSPRMDLAKMLAKLALVESLQGSQFRVWRETRAGLTSMPPDPEVARGHLAASTYLQMQVQPHIMHVVGHSEAMYVATASDVIAACKVVDGTLRQVLLGAPDLAADTRVQERRDHLVSEAGVLLAAIRSLAPAGTPDPYTDTTTLARAVALGLLDAPHLRGNPAGRGQVVTALVGGACVAVDPATRQPLPEAERVGRLLAAHRQTQHNNQEVGICAG